jgi:hypothetical protein
LCSKEGKRKSTGRQGGEVSDDAVMWRGYGREKLLQGKGQWRRRQRRVGGESWWRGEAREGQLRDAGPQRLSRVSLSGEVEERRYRRRGWG